MPSLHQHLWSHLRFRGSAYLVLLIALVPTLIGYWRVETNARHHDQARFEALARSTADLVHDELERFVADVRAFSSLFESTVVVNHREWNTFIDTLGYARRHPGVRSVGYADLVTPDQLAAFNRTMRRRPGSDYEIFPPTTNVLKFPTVQLRQFPTNSDVRLGWDSYSDVTRRAALDTVLKTAGPAVTSKMTYRAGTSSVEEGFTVFVPVFKADGGVRGVIFSAFIPQQLFNAISDRQFSSAVSVQMFDGAAAGSGSLLAVSRVPGHPVPATFSEVRPVRLLDRTFQLRVTTLPAFDEASDSYAPKFVLAGGLAFSLLLFVITWRQGSARTAAEKFNRRLRDSEDRLRAANVELEDKITEARRVEGLLAYERDLLATLLEHSPDAIYFKDRESRFIKCGRAVGGHLKINAASDAAGKTDFDFFTAEHARPAFELEQEIIRTGQPVVGLVEKETWG